MNTKKNTALEKVMRDFEKLGNLVLKQINTVEGKINNVESDLSKSKEAGFFKNEEKIDKLEVKISERIINAIVLYQPVASELRQIMAAYRIVISLERIADHTVSILEFLDGIKNQDVYNELSELVISLYDSASQHLQLALQSFVQQNSESALEVIKQKSDNEKFIKKSLKKIIEKSKEFDEKKKVIISFINIKEVIDNIGRISDHSVNIAEASIYYIEGKDVRHRPFFED